MRTFPTRPNRRPPIRSQTSLLHRGENGDLVLPLLLERKVRERETHLVTEHVSPDLEKHFARPLDVEKLVLPVGAFALREGALCLKKVINEHDIAGAS